MTVNLEDRTHEAQPSPRDGGWIRRAMLSPMDFFRANRRALDEQLSIDGKRAGWTAFDRAHADRHRRAVETAEGALNLARAEQAKPYSLASEVLRMAGRNIKSALTLLRGVALTLWGVGLSVMAAIEARLPDSVLVQHAMRQADEVSPPVSASDQRDLLLWLIGVGAVLLIAGLYGVFTWLRPAPAK